MSTSSFITLPLILERPLPPFEKDDIKYPESLVRHFLHLYTKQGDRVFDPFAGLGTTLFVAEEMGRVPYGIEHDERRRDWVAGQLGHPAHLVRGDSGDMPDFGFPTVDFAMTSPPYMPRHHRWNPLYGGDPSYAGYGVYLERMAHIFGRLRGLMRRRAVFVLQADNLSGRDGYTPLVRDLGLAAERHFRLIDEVIVAWENARSDYRHTHCLIFKNI